MIIKPRGWLAGTGVLLGSESIPGSGVGGSSPQLPGHSLPTFQPGPGPGPARSAVLWLHKPWGHVLLWGQCTWSVGGLIFRPPVTLELAFVPGQLCRFRVVSWGGH